MISINELIEIIASYNGEASLDEIVSAYQRKHKMILFSNHVVFIKNLLENNHKYVLYNEEKDKWMINNDDSQSKVSKNNIHKKTSNPKDIDSLVDVLTHVKEMDPNEHDGSYELVYSTINEYSKVKPNVKFNVSDMDLLYAMSIGTWKIGVPIRKNRIDNSNLNDSSKKSLYKLLDDLWNRALTRKFRCNFEGDNFGMFGSGFMSFNGKLSDSDSNAFIKMLIQIKDLKDENQIFDICEKVICNDNFIGSGLKSASASAILHCFKPFVFPVINANGGHGTIYERLDIKIKNPKDLKSYISNCRLIKAYRDSHFSFKNYRILDVSPWIIDDPKFDYTTLLDLN